LGFELLYGPLTALRGVRGSDASFHATRSMNVDETWELHRADVLSGKTTPSTLGKRATPRAASCSASES
jgi:hypothetical protein